MLLLLFSSNYSFVAAVVASLNTCILSRKQKCECINFNPDFDSINIQKFDIIHLHTIRNTKAVFWKCQIQITYFIWVSNLLCFRDLKFGKCEMRERYVNGNLQKNRKKIESGNRVERETFMKRETHALKMFGIV